MLRAVEGPVPTGVVEGLGGGVAARDGLVVAGGPYASIGGFESGAAWVYRVEDGALVIDSALAAPGIGGGDHFGFAVATDGSLICIGAPEDSGVMNASGSVRVFRHTGSAWSADPIVFAPAAQTGDRFGASVAISGDVLIVGAPGRDMVGASDAGAALVFVWNGAAWIFVQELIAPESDAGDRFGTSVSLHAGRLLIGAFGDDDRGVDAGAGYVFERRGDAWVFAAKLTAADGKAADLLGWSASLGGDGGDIAVLGAPGRDDAGSMAGGAHVFDFQGGAWVEQGVLTPTSASAFDRAGSSVAAGDEFVIVGSPREDADGAEAGSVSVFSRMHGVWSEAAVVRAALGAEGAFGAAVGIDDDILLIGAPDAYGGAGRLLTLPAIGDCDASGTLDACEVANGSLEDSDSDLRPDACDPPPCPGDATGNGVVDIRDLNFVLAFWGQEPYEPFTGADLSGDGFVDIDDLNRVLADWHCRR